MFAPASCLRSPAFAGMTADWFSSPDDRNRMSATAPATRPAFPETLGHPRPLWMLFMSEFWERFAFYGMRWALALYIVDQFFNGDPSGQGDASRTYGAY